MRERVRQSKTSHLPFRDRKKKRFVGQSGQEDKKKIKTESGRYISSSYKRDLYPERLGCGGAGPGLGVELSVQLLLLLEGQHLGAGPGVQLLLL